MWAAVAYYRLATSLNLMNKQGKLNNHRNTFLEADLGTVTRDHEVPSLDQSGYHTSIMETRPAAVLSSLPQRSAFNSCFICRYV